MTKGGDVDFTSSTSKIDYMVHAKNVHLRLRPISDPVGIVLTISLYGSLEHKNIFRRPMVFDFVIWKPYLTYSTV